MSSTDYRGTCPTDGCAKSAYIDLHCHEHRVAIDESKLGPDGFGGPLNLYRWAVRRAVTGPGWLVIKGQQNERSAGPILLPGTETVEATVPTRTLAVHLAETMGAAFWAGRCQERRYHERLRQAELAASTS